MPKAVYLRSLTLDFQLSPSNSSLKSSTLPCRALLGFFMITKPGGTVITNKFECAGLLLDRINKFIWVMDWKQVWGCPFKRTLLERGGKSQQIPKAICLYSLITTVNHLDSLLQDQTKTLNFNWDQLSHTFKLYPNYLKLYCEREILFKRKKFVGAWILVTGIPLLCQIQGPDCLKCIYQKISKTM
jgi:hypothetical protein